ncbi:MAG: Gfo/Idh/MocA family protein [Armatimonadota bacterium]
MSSPIRLAVVGGRRGASFTYALEHLADRLQLTAICDINPAVQDKWRQDFPSIRTFGDFETLLESDVCDAVVVATPMQLHARQAIRALEAGKHVLSEVAALVNMEEGWQLIETVERTGKTYMMAENCCYMRDLMMVKEMAGRGAFGDITVVDCGYLHDCRDLMFTPDGTLTWRGELLRDYHGNMYPTHSIGPVDQWLAAVNPRHRFTSLVTCASEPRVMREFAAYHFGADHPTAQPGFFICGDNNITILQTTGGAMVTLRFDIVSPRPWNNVAFVLQGTRGAYHCGRHPHDGPAVWFEEQPPVLPGEFHINQWQSLWDYADKYEHPCWRQWGEAAQAAGHGGGDFFTLLDFVNAIQQGTRPPIDVYDAVAWSSIIPLSCQSLAEGNRQIDIPDFRPQTK